MSTLKYLPQYFSTTLNVGGGIDNSQTTGIVLQSVSGIDITKPGQICISYSDPLDTGVAEWINYTSINGSNELVGVTRGCEGYSAHNHLPGATIQFVLSASHINDLNDVENGIQGRTITTTAGGTTTYTLTPSPAITAYVTGQEFVIKMNAANTGASTINVSGLGAKSLTKGGATALASGDLLIDAAYKIIYDGTQFQVSGINGSTAATRAENATGTSNTLMLTPQNTHEFHVPPQGFLYNGKIVPSVASNNLTVALKGLDGNDPSATNPVYVRIGDTVRSITAALSFTSNAGTNYGNAGSAELATKEIDWFVYLHWYPNDSSVKIGAARIPYVNNFVDFASFNGTSEKTILHSGGAANSTDDVVVIGRFAATLSAGAGYTWSVPTFTTNNLIQRPIYETRILSCSPTFNSTTLGNGTVTGKYKLAGNICTYYASFTLGSTSAVSTSVNVSGHPFVPLTTAGGYTSSCSFLDSGTGYSIGMGSLISTAFYLSTTTTNAYVATTAPITWANGDAMSLNVIYIF